jgi:hypothetical protein
MAPMFHTFSSRYSRCIALFLLLIPRVVAALPEGTARYSDPVLHFTLDYPTRFVPVRVRHPGVVCALQREGGGLPTFNIIAEPGPYRPVTMKTHEEMVLSSYRKVGITDVRLVTKHDVSIAGGQLQYPALELEYSSQGTPLRSVVTIVPREDMHFILTFLDKGERADPTWRALVQGFSLPRAPSLEHRSAFSEIFILVVVLLFMICAVALIKIYRRDERDQNNGSRSTPV